MSGGPGRRWTIYLAQDKHLDYHWCGSQAGIEARVAALLDGTLDRVEGSDGRWNLDCTLWLDVYRRQRGEEGARRLLDAIRRGQIGYGANRSVLLWGLLSSELAFRACYGSLEIERATVTPNRTVLAMENVGLPWGAAGVLAGCGFAYLGRGVYPLRAESTIGGREPYPLFWWVAPDGGRLLVRWDLYDDGGTWGGYAEAYELARLAGEEWDAWEVHHVGDRNTPQVYPRRVEYVRRTVERYEAYGDAYPISSILLLGTGWDNWVCTDDYAAFVRRFNAGSDGRIRLVDARYDQFFEAAAREIEERGLDVPEVAGSFGICWEEWAAYLAGSTAAFREAERLLRRAEAAHALAILQGTRDDGAAVAIRQGFDALLRFGEHDFGGVDLARAAITAGAKAGAAMEALAAGRALCPEPWGAAWPLLDSSMPEDCTFSWRGGQVRFDAERGGVASLVDGDRREWVPQGGGLVLGEWVRTFHRSGDGAEGVFPPAIPTPAEPRVDRVCCRRGADGVEVESRGERRGMRFCSRWFWHAAQPWIDVEHDLSEGWTQEPQSVQVCFPLAIPGAIYRYDVAGAIQTAGPVGEGGDDLPGANPFLYAVQTFAAAEGDGAGAILLTPDATLVRFGGDAVQAPGVAPACIPAQVVSVPMMNLMRNDWQFAQGGARRWTFRYRLVLVHGACEPLRPIREAQRFGVAPWLHVDGVEPSLPGLGPLDLDFCGGPLVAVKAAEDGERLILRLWNVLDAPAVGSLNLPRGYARVERCDGLERPREDLPGDGGQVTFVVGARAILTLALCP